MRIQRLIFVLLALILMALPQVKAEAFGQMSLDTKTKVLFPMFLQETKISLNSEGFVLPEKNMSPVDPEREAKLAIWKEKQAHLWQNLPQGKFTINASAYTAAADECGKSDGVTASGVKVEQKRTLACPPNLPFGTKLNIDGLGTFVCEDRGGAIKGNKIDIYMETKKEAFQFGRQNLIAEVVM